jgi:nucleotide-binding universal stress UspA family protein
MDLSHPDQIRITERGRQIQGTGFKEHFKRWLKAAGMHYQPSPLPSQQIKEVPILMVALPHADVSDATWYSLREAVDRSLGIRPGARLACVTVISPGDTSSTESSKSESSVHRMHLARMQQWSQGLDLHDHQVSFHVLEASDVAHALVKYAEGNEVSMILMGAATHGLQMQRFVATVPTKVAMAAPCTVILVKQDVPFEFLGTLNDE